MIFRNKYRGILGIGPPLAGRWGWVGLCCGLLAVGMAGAQEQGEASSASSPAAGTAAAALAPVESKRQARAAEDAYLAGARKLARDDLSGAQAEFARALKLNPTSHEYAAAVDMTREHRLTELLEASGQARMAGDAGRAETLLAEARALDPQNPMLPEHAMAAAVSQRDTAEPSSITPGLTDRTQLLAGEEQPWQRATLAAAGAIELTPTAAIRDFHVHGDAREVLRQVAAGYGIHTTFDDSVEAKPLRFDLDNVTYAQAMGMAMTMAHAFAVPLDATSVLIAKDDAVHRAQLERQMEETIYLSGLTIEQINDLANVVRNVFEVKQTSVQSGLGSIVVRAPEATLTPMNRTLKELIDANGEVMLDLKLYTVDKTRTSNVGFSIPTQAGIYNVDQAATALVNANQTLVQEAIAQGLVTSTTSNIQIALALIASGLVQSSLLSSTVGFFGGKTTMTGITESGGAVFNLALNESDARAVDDVQLRVDDRQTGVFRAGTRYPVTTSTYSTGLSSATTAALAGQTINGVSVASLLGQLGAGTGTTVPQVTYEDLGVTLKATPAIEKSGRVAMHLELKIEALTGSSANGIPVLGSQAFTGDITVPDGESAMMISHLTRNETAAVTGIPGLSDVPGFQAPLDNNGSVETDELVLLVTPRVVRHRSSMVAGPRVVVQVHEPGN